MTLRKQLLLVSLLLLTLPWAGIALIREMEAALREGQARSLQSTAAAVAAMLEQREPLLYPAGRRQVPANQPRAALYAFPAASPIIIDGYGDAWEDIPEQTYGGSGRALRVKAQSRGGSLYLLFDITDSTVVYHNPGISEAPNGDRLILRFDNGRRRQDVIVDAQAPGTVRTSVTGFLRPVFDTARVRGVWQDTPAGFSVELTLPLSYTRGGLGFFFLDRDGASTVAKATIGNVDADSRKPLPSLVYQPDSLHDILSSLSRTAAQIQVVDSAGWRLANITPRETDAATSSETFWLLRLFYRAVLAQDAPGTLPAATHPGKLAGREVPSALAGQSTVARYAIKDSGAMTLLSAAAPIRGEDEVLGAVVVRQSGETYLAFTDQAFGRLLGYSLLALSLAAVGLVGYASLLSFRIRRLSNAARAAVTEDGRVTDNFQRSSANDEIGELSRQYGDLLSRLREYNDYLHGLSQKLSHELRTPIAVIGSSLDNLEHCDDSEAIRTYTERAREGLRRLQHILAAMSEAARLEESIRKQIRVAFDLVPVLDEVTRAYATAYPEHRIVLNPHVDTATTGGNAELLVQALDKLVENAASFTAPGGDITISLNPADDCWNLSVSNPGAVLDESAVGRIFEPMVSLRDKHSEGSHMGLGLHVVRLIAEFHNAALKAENMPDGSGVRITLALPKLSASAVVS